MPPDYKGNRTKEKSSQAQVCLEASGQGLDGSGPIVEEREASNTDRWWAWIEEMGLLAAGGLGHRPTCFAEHPSALSF